MQSVHADALLQIERTTAPRGLRLTGQVDATNEASLATQLYGLDRPEGNHTVDLRRVTFLSFTGLRLLVCFAQTLLDGRRLVLLTRGPHVRTLLAACRWEQLPSLALAPEETGDA